MKLGTFWKKYLKLFIFLSCLILFLMFMVCVLNNIEMELKIDNFGYNVVSKYLIADNRTSFVKIITNLGSSLCLIILTVLSFVVFRNKKVGLSVTINLITITILNLLLKNIIGRERPNINMLIEETGYSFPSGHSMISMAFYGYFIYLIYRYVKNRTLKWVLIVMLGILIICIGVSRIYLGVHYTSDVISGFLAATAYLILFIGIANKYLYGGK